MTIELGVLISVLGLIIAYQTFQLNRQKTVTEQNRNEQRDVRIDAQESARIQAQLEYIGKGVDDIRVDLKANEKQIGALNERVVRVEEANKQMNKRIEKIEKGGV